MKNRMNQIDKSVLAPRQPRNWKPLIYAAVVSLAAVGGALWYRTPQDAKGLTYSGKLGDQKVQYVETSGKNVLEVMRGNETYRFVDSRDAVPLDWQSNAPTTNAPTRLEEVAIVKHRKFRPDPVEVFSVENVDSRTLAGMKTADILMRGSIYFDNTRAAIQKTLRKDYVGRVGNLDGFLQREVKPADIQNRYDLEESLTSSNALEQVEGLSRTPDVLKELNERFPSRSNSKINKSSTLRGK